MYRMYTSGVRNLPVFIFALGLLVISFTSIAQNTHIREKGFIRINGIEQWITIKGERSKPVILFLHGGPGSPLSQYADALFDGWETEFVLVQWDQRGAGKTFGRTAPAELSPAYIRSHPLTVEEMIEDGIAVAEYLIKHLDKQKLILFGTSWGSVLGIQMAAKRPDLFHAYIGHSQLAYPGNDLKLAYQEVYQQAQKASDQQSLAVLHSIGAPPYDTAQHVGRFLRIVKKYEQQNSKPMPGERMKMAPEYDNPTDSQHRSDGDDYSFVHFTGDKRLQVQAMSRPASGLRFAIPVYLIQGEADIMTPKEISRPYFDKIAAPGKEYIVVPAAAHGFNMEVLKALFDTCKKIKDKLATGKKE